MKKTAEEILNAAYDGNITTKGYIKYADALKAVEEALLQATAPALPEATIKHLSIYLEEAFRSHAERINGEREEPMWLSEEYFPNILEKLFGEVQEVIAAEVKKEREMWVAVKEAYQACVKYEKEMNDEIKNTRVYLLDNHIPLKDRLTTKVGEKEIVDLVKQIINEKDAEIQALKEMLDSFTSEIETGAPALVSLEEENKFLKEEIVQLKEQLEERSDDVISANASMAHYKSLHESVEAKLTIAEKQLSERKGMQWVLFSDKKPPTDKRVHWLDDEEEGGYAFYFRKSPLWKRPGIKWLDDAPLPELSGNSGELKEEAVAFAEWAIANNWHFVEGWGWMKGHNANRECHPASVVYKKYLQQKEKSNGTTEI